MEYFLLGLLRKRKKWWFLANFDFQGEESWPERGRVCACATKCQRSGRLQMEEDSRWSTSGRNALKKGNNGCRQAELCIVIETSRPASPGLYCTPVGLTQVEVTVPLSFLSLHCLSIIEQRQLNFPLSFHAFNWSLLKRGASGPFETVCATAALKEVHFARFTPTFSAAIETIETVETIAAIAFCKVCTQATLGLKSKACASAYSADSQCK